MSPQTGNRQKVYFLLSVDAEEEFDWGGEFPQSDCSVENIKQLPLFQSFCDSIGIRPTYLVDYPVACDPESSAILKEIVETGKAEIGAHLHPWCTPPLVGSTGERESHVVNLGKDLVKSKLHELTRAIESNLNVTPKAFRTGRWGINGDVLQIVKEAGYTIDSSVFPFYSNDYFSCMRAPYEPYWPDLVNPDLHGQQNQILELPVTAGFNRKNFDFWKNFHDLVSKPPFNFLKVVGVAWRIGLLRKIYFSPELASEQLMQELVRVMLAKQTRIFHMFLHSSTFLPGDKGYTFSSMNIESMLHSIRRVVEYICARADVEFLTLSEFGSKVYGLEK